jgi:hypothetical protein
MKRKYILVAGILLLIVLTAYLVCAFWFTSSDDRPTLMYFRADL